jgi:hypothetical protein
MSEIEIDRKLRDHITAIIMIRDFTYTLDAACGLAEMIIEELGLQREDTPMETWQGTGKTPKSCYRYTTSWCVK